MRNHFHPTFVAVILLSAPIAQSAEPIVITLSCDGKKTDAKSPDAKPEAIANMGLVVNLKEKTVSGVAGVIARINKVDAAHISFANNRKTSLLGIHSEPSGDLSVLGDIDRVTGAVSVTTMTPAATYQYDLTCKPANRMF